MNLDTRSLLGRIIHLQVIIAVCCALLAALYGISRGQEVTPWSVVNAWLFALSAVLYVALSFLVGIVHRRVPTEPAAKFERDLASVTTDPDDAAQAREIAIASAQAGGISVRDFMDALYWWNHRNALIAAGITAAEAEHRIYLRRDESALGFTIADPAPITLAMELHEASEHAAYGIPFADSTCTCEQLANRFIATKWLTEHTTTALAGLRTEALEMLRRHKPAVAVVYVRRLLRGES